MFRSKLLCLHSRRAVIALCCGSAAATVHAAPLIQDVQAVVTRHVQSVAEQHGLTEADIEVSVLPPKRPPAACSAPFEVKVTNDRHLSRILAEARCPDHPTQRTVLVARASVKASIPVAARDIAAGQTIEAADLVDTPRVVASLTDTVLRSEDAVGQASRRAIRAQQVLSRKFIRAPEAVHKGQSVRIVVEGGGLAIDTAGVALEGGAEGDTIRVRNSSSGKTIQGKVTGPGVVAPTGAPPQDPVR